MKFVAICAKGLEDITQLEIKEILKIDSFVILPGRVTFETKNVKILIEKTQSIIKIYELKQQCKTLDEIKTFPIEAPFRVICSRKGEHTFTSQDVEKQIGTLFYKENNEVDLKDPKTIVFLDILQDDILVGTDLTPTLLSKREYRIRVHNQSVNACIAYGLVRLSGFDNKKVLVDPFAKDGIVAIEAALFAKGKIFAFASLFPDVKKVEINAKLANVRKDIKMSRVDVEWLDTKFKEGEVDCVVSIIPFVSKHVKESNVKKIYKELFYHLNYILNKNSKVVLLVPKTDLLKEMNEKLKIVEERTVSTSNLQYQVVVFKR